MQCAPPTTVASTGECGCGVTQVCESNRTSSLYGNCVEGNFTMLGLECDPRITPGSVSADNDMLFCGDVSI